MVASAAAADDGARVAATGAADVVLELGVVLVVVGVVLVVAFLVVLVVDGVPACWGLRSGTVSLGRTASLVVGGLKFVEIRRNSFGGNQ